MKPLLGGLFTTQNRAELKTNSYTLEIDPKLYPIEWVFNPQFWINVTHIRKNDLIRIIATDGSYDFVLKVSGRVTGGKLAARMSIWSGYGDNLPDYVREAETAATSTALFPTTYGGRLVPRVEHVELDGWRVIGFDNLVASRGYENEARARAAMREYVNVYGFKTISDQPAVDAMTGAGADPAEKTALPQDSMSFQKRKEIEKREKRDAQRSADLEQLNRMKAEREAASLPQQS